MALRSSLTFAVAGPDSSISVVIAALVATVVQRLIANGRRRSLGPPDRHVVGDGADRTVALRARIHPCGRAIRFMPYPVIGGFLGATGWLMITGAMQVVTDRQAALTNIPAFFDTAIAAKLAAVVGVALVLHVVLRRSKSPFAMPGVLLAVLAMTYLALLLSGTPLTAARSSGWMFQPQPVANLTLPYHTEALRHFPWAALPSLAGDVLAVMFVTISTLLLNTTGIEIATRSEADIERDLKVLGIANLATAALGGFVSCTVAQPFNSGPLRRRHRPARRIDGRGDLGRHADRQSVVPRLRAQIRARRTAVLSRLRPRLSMADPLVAAAPAGRISVADRHRLPHHLLGLHRRRVHRHRHRLCDVCAEREPRQRHQVQFRRLGISLFTRSRTARAVAHSPTTAGRSRA